MTRSIASEAVRLVAGSKLIALHAPANVAIGDRRSRAAGPGIEFAQYRDYEPGDDLRHLDRHVYARSGRTVIRQQHVEQRLRVSVLLDATGSMGVNRSTWLRAVEMAAIFGQAAINGADQVQLGVAGEKGVAWGPVASRHNQLRREIDRLESVTPHGGLASLAEAVAHTLHVLANPGLLVVISDWLVEGFAEALKLWRVRGQEIVAVQVLGSPESGGGPGVEGWLRLIDAESGETVERRIDARTLSLYRAAVAERSERVRAAVWGVEGRWVAIDANEPVREDVVRELRSRGLIT